MSPEKKLYWRAEENLAHQVSYVLSFIWRLELTLFWWTLLVNSFYNFSILLQNTVIWDHKYKYINYLVSIHISFLLWIGMLPRPPIKTSDRLRNSDIFASFEEIWFLTVDKESFYPTVFLENLPRWEYRFRCFLKNMTVSIKQDSMIYHDSKVT